MLKLHGYFRSTASWRVRIALALKDIEYEQKSYNLRNKEHSSKDFLAINPQGLIPVLELENGILLPQSLAIIEWLEEFCPVPAILPKDPLTRAQVRAFALTIVADTHPIQNLRVLNALRSLHINEDKVTEWAADFIRKGLSSCEQVLAKQQATFCFGSTPGLADVCLIPQLGNARRFGVDLTEYPMIMAVEANCYKLDAFKRSVPDRQPDAE